MAAVVVAAIAAAAAADSRELAAAAESYDGWNDPRTWCGATNTGNGEIYIVLGGIIQLPGIRPNYPSFAAPWPMCADERGQRRQWHR